MPTIQLLDEETIEKIAAGEVVERPASVVKELLENAIDAKATCITVEIKDGGTSFIRITDNGCGIDKDQVRIAFLRHATSKIRSVTDLLTVSSLGFRGEALSSISAVAQVELITKTSDSITGVRYVIEGTKEKSYEEIGAPGGTTFLVRNLFYNTPARRKFLKSAQTEAGYISTMIEKIALSHPEISFQFINNNQTKLHTSGNNNAKDIIYHIYGRDIAMNLIEINAKTELMDIHGYIGKPVVSRGNRNFENYFLNGRYVKSALLSKAIEDAYKSYMMQHQYPFTVLDIRMPEELMDVNVHPTKMELRFTNQQQIYDELLQVLSDALAGRNLIPEVTVDSGKTRRVDEKTADKAKRILPTAPEPFERKRIEAIQKSVRHDSPYEPKYGARPLVKEESIQKIDHQEERISATVSSKHQELKKNDSDFMGSNNFDLKIIESKSINIKQNELHNIKAETVIFNQETKIEQPEKQATKNINKVGMAENSSYMNQQADKTITHVANTDVKPGQLSMTDFVAEEDAAFFKKQHQIIGQLFDTYWLVEVDENLYIIDQHAAHEKVLFEQKLKQFKDGTVSSQQLSPPTILTLSMQEQTILEEQLDSLEAIGFHISHFGGNEYAISAVPNNLYDMNPKEFFLELFDDITSSKAVAKITPESLWDKIATASCKAAVKGNHRLSRSEIENLLDQLLKLDNPFHCPHGRPTIVSMSKQEIERKFKRII